MAGAGTGVAGPPSLREILLLLLLALIWGSSFLFIKVAVAEIPPVSLVTLRLGLALLALMPLAVWLHRGLPASPRVWGHYLIIAVSGNLLPYGLITWGEVSIDSGLAAILLAFMPVATVILAHWTTEDDRLSRGKLSGVLFGFLGVVLLVGPDALAGLGLEVAAQLAVVAAGLCYGVANIYARRSRLTDLPPLVNAACILLCATIVSVPLALVLERPLELTPGARALGAALGLALLSTAAGNLILFRLLARNGASFVALVNYLIPLFGVIWGALLLAEPLTWRGGAALLLILFGVALSQARRSSDRRRELRRAAGKLGDGA